MFAYGELPMSSRRKGHVASNSKALAKTTIFGPPPILMGEDERVYDDLLEKVSSDIKPKGIIEQILIKDVVDLTYELFRLRGLKAAWLSDIIPDCLEEFLEPHIRRSAKNEESDTPSLAGKLARKWAEGNRAAHARVEKLVASRKLVMASVYAYALTDRFDDIERIDRMIITVEGRRNAVFREIDRHRIALSRALSDNIHEIEDAEFETIEPEAVIPKIANDKNAA